MSILPDFATGEPLSATKLNALTEALAYVDSVSRSARNPVRDYASIPNGTTVTGYIVHQYNTLIYAVDGYADLTLKVNDVAVSLTGNTGTADITTLSLTVGNIYPVTLKANAASTSLYYIYESLTETYGAGPTTFTGATATATVTQLNQVRDYIDDLLNLAQCPPTSFNRTNVGQAGWDREEDDPVYLWSGWLRHIHNTVEYRFIHAAGAGKGGRQKSQINIYVNGDYTTGTLVLSRKTFSAAAAGQTVESVGMEGAHGQDVHAELVYGTVDITALGLTVGTWYQWTVYQNGSGTSNGIDLTSYIHWLAESGGSPAAGSPSAGYDRFWVEGAKTATDTNLNTFVTSINALHPGAASPTSPMYYDNPVSWYRGTHWYLNRRSKYLAYVWAGTGTPEISVLSENAAMSAKTGNQFFDIDKCPNLFYGQRMEVDDVKAVFGVDSVSTIA